MSELNSVRMGNFAKRNQETIRSITNPISQLSVSLPDALLQLCSVVKNPDAIADMPTSVAATQAQTAAAIAEFRAMQSMVDDYERVRDNPEEVDNVISERSLDVVSMSLNLIKG